jgi:hypothetical protein
MQLDVRADTIRVDITTESLWGNTTNLVGYCIHPSIFGRSDDPCQDGNLACSRENLKKRILPTRLAGAKGHLPLMTRAVQSPLQRLRGDLTSISRCEILNMSHSKDHVGVIGTRLFPKRNNLTPTPTMLNEFAQQYPVPTMCISMI